MTTSENPKHVTREVTQRVDNGDGTFTEIRAKERRLKRQHEKQVARERARLNRAKPTPKPESVDTDPQDLDSESPAAVVVDPTAEGPVSESGSTAADGTVDF